LSVILDSSFVLLNNLSDHILAYIATLPIDHAFQHLTGTSSVPVHNGENEKRPPPDDQRQP